MPIEPTPPAEFATDLPPTSRTPAWLLPVGLGALMTLAAVLLVWVELAQPASTFHFKGIRFSNTINSPGATNSVILFREHLDWMPRPFKSEALSGSAYLFGLRFSLLAMFAVQIAAIVASRRARLASPWVWAIGPVFASFVLLFYPPTSTDIFAYASFGWVGDMGENPYIDIPRSVTADPYARFNDWTHITTPYGPIWTGISQGIVHVTNRDPFWTAILFKLVAMVFAFGLAALTWFLARRFTSDPRLTTTAFVLVCWSPVLLFESVGPMHLDAVMMSFAILGLLVATGTRIRSPRLGLLLTVCSVMVKPATLPLVALMALTRFARPDPLPIILRRVALDFVVVVGALVIGYAPFIEGDLIAAINHNAHQVFIDRPLHSNPLWMWALAHVDSVLGVSGWIGGDSGSFSRWMAIAMAAVVAIVLARTVIRQRRNSVGIPEDENYQAKLRFLLLSWAAVTVIIGILPLNAHQWYVIWSMVPLAILWISDGTRDRKRPPYWLIGLQTWIIVSFMIYHTLPKR